METHNTREVEKIVEEFKEIYGDYLTGYFCCNGRECGCNGTEVDTEAYCWLRTTLHQQIQKAKEEERERINQFFAVKADYDTDNDCVILTDKVYHQAFFPDGCGSDGQNGRNRCEVCYKYRTKFSQNILAKLEPDHSELDQPTV